MGWNNKSTEGLTALRVVPVEFRCSNHKLFSPDLRALAFHHRCSCLPADGYAQSPHFMGLTERVLNSQSSWRVFIFHKQTTGHPRLIQQKKSTPCRCEMNAKPYYIVPVNGNDPLTHRNIVQCISCLQLGHKPGEQALCPGCTDLITERSDSQRFQSENKCHKNAIAQCSHLRRGQYGSWILLSKMVSQDQEAWLFFLVNPFARKNSFPW